MLSPADGGASVTERKRRRLDMDGVKSPGNRAGRKISEYFKVHIEILLLKILNNAKIFEMIEL